MQLAKCIGLFGIQFVLNAACFSQMKKIDNLQRLTGVVTGIKDLPLEGMSLTRYTNKILQVMLNYTHQLRLVLQQKPL